jgi:hypothetical protein
MRIISDIKDYYDFPQDYQDSLIYKRDHKKIKIESAFNFGLKEPSNKYNQFFSLIPNIHFGRYDLKTNKEYTSYHYREIGVICFCGDFYPYVCLTLENKNSQVFDFVFYNLNSLEEVTGRDWNRKTYIDFFNDWSYDRKIFFELKSPVFIFNRNSFDENSVNPFKTTGECSQILYMNPILKEYVFYVLSDGYQTYQRIDMFLSNELAEDKTPIPETVEEKHRMNSRFGGKYSFRRMLEIK